MKRVENEVIEKTESSIKRIVDEGLTTNNIDLLYKLSKIKHMAKEDKEMNHNAYNGYNNYNNYDGGRMPGFNSYGNNQYGRQGQDIKYRGHESLDRMYNDYTRYEEGRQRYGANEDTKRSLKYMLESMEDFARMLREDAQSQEEIEMIRQTAQRIAQM